MYKFSTCLILLVAANILVCLAYFNISFVTTYAKPAEVQGHHDVVVEDAVVHNSAVEDPDNVSKKECQLEKPFLCVLPRGRLGNQICEYVHLLLINASYSVDIAVTSSMRNSLAKIFPNLSVSQVCEEHKTKCPTKEKKVNYPEVLGALNNSKHGDIFTLSATPCDLKLISNGKKLWEQDLAVSLKLKTHAARRLQDMTARWLAVSNRSLDMENLTRVGVHVRRSDYTAVLRKYHFGDERLLPPQYYKAAFEYYRNRFK